MQGLERVEVNCLKADYAGPNKQMECLFSNEWFNIEDNNFLQLATFKSGSNLDTIERTKFAGVLQIHNIRPFLQDLQGFVDTDDPANYMGENPSNDQYSFEESGAGRYDFFEKGESIVNCPVCESTVNPEEEFLSLTDFALVQSDKSRNETPRHFDCIHRGCVEEFIEEIKRVAGSDNTFAKVI